MYQTMPHTQATMNPCLRVKGRRERPSESRSSPSPPRPRNSAYNSGTKAIQHRKKRFACGNMMICSPAETRDSTQALAGILNTGEILTKHAALASGCCSRPSLIETISSRTGLILANEPERLKPLCVSDHLNLYELEEAQAAPGHGERGARAHQRNL